MPEADATQEGQEPETQNGPASSAAPATGGGSLDSFPEEAQDYIRRLRQEAAKYRNDLKATTGKLKEFEDRDKTEAQKLADQAAAAERQASESTVKLLRYEVAAATGLPLSLASRLQGSNEAELKADAENLKEQFGLSESDGPAGGSGFDGGVRRPVTKPKTMNGIIRQASGR
jgi:hypothetical protein